MGTGWLGRLLTAAGLAAALTPGAPAGTQPAVTVCPTCEVKDLRAAVAAAPAGAVVQVLGGTYPGPVVVDRPLTLIGRDRPVIDGGGQGSVVIVTAPGVRLEGFVIRGSGSSHDHEDSAVRRQRPGGGRG
jgi:nitrous oxidase accessory protein